MTVSTVERKKVYGWTHPVLGTFEIRIDFVGGLDLTLELDA